MRTRSAGTDDGRNGTTTRGQTEPLAALVSIAAICTALTLYAGITTNVFSVTGSERAVADATVDGVWTDVSERGVFDSTTTNLSTAIDTRTLPKGRYVRTNVTVVSSDGTLTTVDSATFDQSGTRRVGMVPPETARSETRPVPVRVDDGDVRPARLTVVVWQ